MSLKHIASKLLAGGLTAGIVLIWWPRHYPTDGLEWLVLRGIVATLGFEFMLMAYAPLEERLVARFARRFGAGRLRARVDAVPGRARMGGSLLFAGGALALPLMLLASAGAPPAEHEASSPVRVVREIVVKRQVVRDETVVSAGATPDATLATSAATGDGSAAPVESKTPRDPSSTAADRDDASTRAGDREAEARAPSFEREPRAGTEPEATTPDPQEPASGSTSASPTPAPPVDADAATAQAEPPTPAG